MISKPSQLANSESGKGVFPARRDRGARLGAPDDSVRLLNPGNEGVLIP